MIWKAVAQYDAGNHKPLLHILQKSKKFEELKYGEFTKFNKNSTHNISFIGRINECFGHNREALECYEACEDGMYLAARLKKRIVKLQRVKPYYRGYINPYRHTGGLYSRYNLFMFQSLLLEGEFLETPTLLKFIEYNSFQQSAKEKYAISIPIPNLEIPCDNTRKKLISEIQQLIPKDLYVVDLRVLIAQFLV